MPTLELCRPVTAGSEPIPGDRCAPTCALLCTPEGFADAHRRYAAELIGFCRRSLADHGLAEEITQEVFFRAWRRCARFEDRDDVAGADDPSMRLRAWLFTIARNAVVDSWRSRSRRPALHPDPDGAVNPADPADAFARSDTREQVHGGLAALGAAHRNVLVAVYLDDLDHAQVSERLGIPIGTVKSRVHYGLRALRSHLDQKAGATAGHRAVRPDPDGLTAPRVQPNTIPVCTGPQTSATRQGIVEPHGNDHDGDRHAPPHHRPPTRPAAARAAGDGVGDLPRTARDALGPPGRARPPDVPDARAPRTDGLTQTRAGWGGHPPFPGPHPALTQTA